MTEHRIRSSFQSLTSIQAEWPVFFRVLGRLRNVETIATGAGIRELPRLRKLYGIGRWRKRKGDATIQLDGGPIRDAELHWYEASGIGKKEFKIKRFLD